MALEQDGTTTETVDENTPPVEDENTPTAEGEETPDGEGTQDTPEGKTLSQDEVNNIVTERLKRAREKWEEERAEAERRAKMDAEERAKLEREEAEARASERVATANSRLIRADAKTIAAELGTKPERINAVLRLADLSEITVSDDGEVDGGAIRSTLETVLSEYPEFSKPDYGKAPGNRKPAEQRAPTGVDAKIQEAMDAGNFILAERLHAEKLASQGKLGHPT
jgi:hypothetical protein